LSELEQAIFPVVSLELAKPIYRSGGAVFAAAGTTVNVRGNERGQFASVQVVNPHTRREIEASFADIAGAKVLEVVPL
jgi:hypothetical protein